MRDTAMLAPSSDNLRLTSRQREIVTLRLRRLGRREIAHRLGMSPRTVKAHLDDARGANGFRDEVQLLIAVDREARGRET